MACGGVVKRSEGSRTFHVQSLEVSFPIEMLRGCAGRFQGWDSGLPTHTEWVLVSRYTC